MYVTDFVQNLEKELQNFIRNCMDANPNQRPTASELHDIFYFWCYKGEEIKEAFKEADKEIPKISTSYKKNPDSVYTSRAFTFSNLPKPVNSSLMNSYLKKDEDEGTVLYSMYILNFHFQWLSILSYHSNRLSGF